MLRIFKRMKKTPVHLQCIDAYNAGTLTTVEVDSLKIANGVEVTKTYTHIILYVYSK